MSWSNLRLTLFLVTLEEKKTHNYLDTYQKQQKQSHTLLYHQEIVGGRLATPISLGLSWPLTFSHLLGVASHLLSLTNTRTMGLQIRAFCCHRTRVETGRNDSPRKTNDFKYLLETSNLVVLQIEITGISESKWFAFFWIRIKPVDLDDLKRNILPTLKERSLKLW